MIFCIFLQHVNYLVCIKTFHIHLIQTRGDRLYLDEKLKVKISLVETLKAMNQNYPKTSADFDEEFLFLAIRGLFSAEEIAECSAQQKLIPLNRQTLAFLKGEKNINEDFEIQDLSIKSLSNRILF